MRRQVWLDPCPKDRWEHFAPFHYMTTGLNKSANTFVAMTEINGQPREIGFAAALTLPSGTLTGAYRSHKIVVRLPESHPEHLTLWAAIADALAQHYVDKGKRFFGHAPVRLTGYRDESGSGWKPTSTAKAQRAKGYGAYEYAGKGTTTTPTIEETYRQFNDSPTIATIQQMRTIVDQFNADCRAKNLDHYSVEEHHFAYMLDEYLILFGGTDEEILARRTEEIAESAAYNHNFLEMMKGLQELVHTMEARGDLKEKIRETIEDIFAKSKAAQEAEESVTATTTALVHVPHATPAPGDQ